MLCIMLNVHLWTGIHVFTVRFTSLSTLYTLSFLLSIPLHCALPTPLRLPSLYILLLLSVYAILLPFLDPSLAHFTPLPLPFLYPQRFSFLRSLLLLSTPHPSPLLPLHLASPLLKWHVKTFEKLQVQKVTEQYNKIHNSP